jgi:hypothetical protein
VTEQPEQPGNDDADATENDEPTVLETWTSPFGSERDKRKADLEAMPGFRLHGDFDALRRAGHVMSKNADELNRHAAKFRQRRTMARDTTDEYANELVRYLHNYLTSVTSLIDSQRVVMRHCWGSGSEFETGAYTEHRKASFGTGEAEFMKDLRNYCTHRSIPLPGISTNFSWVQGGPTIMENKLTLDRETLLDWDGWTAPAKEYLRAIDEKFDLLPVLYSYVTTASEFYSWFVNEIRERNADDIGEYTKAVEDYNEWHREEMGMNTPGFKKLFPDMAPGNRAERRGQRPQPKRTSKSNRKGKRK